MDKLRKWLRTHDSSGVREKALVRLIQQGKSLKQLEAYLNGEGFEDISTETIRRYILSLDDTIKESWLNQRPRNRLLGKLREKLGIDEARNQVIDENVKVCPHCGRILESSNIYIKPLRSFDFNRECVVERCVFCKGILGYVDSPNVVTAEEWEREERKQRSRELYGF